ncbi:hypothetical protein X956_06640 [Trueperella pyogenes TP8]|uniref:polyphenol oxidase family protein n=1 Tax=Trueperella pyogenes TaxID=1661 RepID=UPI0005820D74|nr:polyphenol oxidase family protein [Trueperella pyogenes]AJC69751.1 hypothetical protein X956_06640 [Trueperella pyogenes TP8]
MHECPSHPLVDWFAQPTFPANVRAGFTTIRGGCSGGKYAALNLGFHVHDDPQSVRANRHKLEHYLGQNLAWMTQVHATGIARASAAHKNREGFLEVGEADAIIVERGYAGAVMVADCVPLILVEKSGERGGVVHVGRAGLDLAIAPKVLEELGEVVAILGPSICGTCYEVPLSLAEGVGRRWPGSRSTTSAGTPGLDIAAGLEAQLRQYGVAEIHRVPVCTYESGEHYSHRRATHAGTGTGRFAGVLQIL